MFVMAVSLPGETNGYAIMANIIESDVASFDANPTEYEKSARGNFIDLFKGHDSRLNQ